MSTAFPFVAEGARAETFWLAFLISVGIVAFIGAVGPRDIASEVETARSEPELDEAIRSWGRRGRLRAAVGLGADFLLIPAYVFAIGLACEILARGSVFPWPTIGTCVAGLQYLAGASDILENVLLLVLLYGGFQEKAIASARVATKLKLGLILTGLTYVFVSLFCRLS